MICMSRKGFCSKLGTREGEKPQNHTLLGKVQNQVPMLLQGGFPDPLRVSSPTPPPILLHLVVHSMGGGDLKSQEVVPRPQIKDP